MRILAEAVTAEESTLLEAVTEQWEREKEKGGTTRRALRLPRFMMPLAVAATLVAAIVTVKLLVNYGASPKSGSDVVQLLLTQHRPFESRMAGEPYVPIVRTRGTDDPRVSYPLVAGEMTRLSANSHEMGRFYLLQKDFDRAIPYLEIAAREVGATPAVHNDLAVAYLESGNAARIEKAGDEFRQALES